MGILVFDFGGSAVKYGCWDSKDVKGKGQFATPESWKEMKAQLLQVYKDMCLSFEIEGIGISSPGVVNNEKQVIEGI
ncbi:MAG: ROK family protein, partial [Enterococcus sp.]